MAPLERLRIVPSILVMGTIFYLSHQPGDSFDLPTIPGLDKFAHFLIYSVLACTLIFAQRRSTRLSRPLMVVAATVAVCFLHGIADEFHQSFIPGRFASGADLIADLLGAVVASLAWLKWWRTKTAAR